MPVPRFVASLLTTLPLLLGIACKDLRQFRVEADPPINVIRIGTDHVGMQTPFLYPIPKSMRSEPESNPTDEPDWKAIRAPRYMEILIRDGSHARSLYRFEKVFRYPAHPPSLMSRGRTRPQGWMDLMLPGLETTGRIWLRGRGPSFRLYSSRVETSMIVRNPMSALQRFHDLDDGSGLMSPTATTVEYVSPGREVISMEHWRLEMDIPAGVTLFVDQGQGRSEYLHLSWPKDLALRLDKGDKAPLSTWVHGKTSLLEPILADASAWKTSMLRYGDTSEVSIQIHLPRGRLMKLRVKIKDSRFRPPPLLLAITDGPSPP